jgi:hypothetical protein
MSLLMATRKRLLALSGLLLALLLFSVPALPTSYPVAPVDSFARLRQLFVNPPAEYRTLPFIVWNGEVNEPDLERYMAGYQAQGSGGVFIHPRPGLITEYMSDRWYGLVRYTVDQAAKRGMQAWLYDENSYPSGFAGGHVPATMPESWNQGQGLTPEKLQQVDAANASKYKIILKKEGAGYRAVTAAEAAAPGDYYAFSLAFYPKQAWMGGFSYTDLIKPGVTEKFIELTMKGYEKSIGRDFGKTVPGIFTDEPNINAPGRRSLRWTPDLFEQFQKRWGYDLAPNLPSLYDEIGDWRKVRHNYYGLLLELFIDRWSKPWRKYTDSKNLAWTGHYWEHGWPNPGHGPDNMAMYAYHHVPGIDMLFNQFAEEVNSQFGNVRAVKELASAANQMGYRRTLSETYGGAGWELRFEDMKRLGDWEYVLGVNMMNQHLSFGTMLGARKYDYPPSFSYHAPWWNHYKAINDYFGRLSLALSSGEQVNRILVIEPTTSAWLYSSPGAPLTSVMAGPPPANRMLDIGKSFQSFLNTLEAMQCEYDLGSENIMQAHGRVNGTALTVGKRSYDLVVLPPGTENLDAGVVKLLSSYLEAGGTVLSFVEPPARVDGAKDARVADLASKHEARWVKADSLDDAGAKHRLAPADIRNATGKLFHQRRKMSDGELLFFVNSSLEQHAFASISFAQGSLVKLDLFTGAREAFPVQGGKASIDLPPAGSILLVATRTPVAAPAPLPELALAPVDKAGALTIKRTQPNALRIDYLDLELGGATEHDTYFFPAQEKVFKHFGLETNPWNHAVQYKTSVIDKNKTLPEGGFAATFRFDVEEGVDTKGLKAVVERSQSWRVTVNGKPVEPLPGQWWLDRAFAVYAVGPHVQKGANAIRLEAKRMTVHHELEPIHLIGDFGVVAREKGWKLAALAPLALGAWKDQRLPFYSDAMSYSRPVTLARVPARAKVVLGKWAGTMAEVKVNGKPAGVIGWQPYELEIAKLLRAGANQIEVVVYGSRKNLLGPHHGKISRGLSSPWSFRQAPPSQPAGSAYDLDACGLVDDFRVTSSR